MIRKTILFLLLFLIIGCENKPEKIKRLYEDGMIKDLLFLSTMSQMQYRKTNNPKDFMNYEIPNTLVNTNNGSYEITKRSEDTLVFQGTCNFIYDYDKYSFIGTLKITRENISPNIIFSELNETSN